jgi:hypothetical protein
LDLEHPDYESNIDENTLRYEFVRWALSIFPKLLFVAFGDFSYGSQFTSTHEILHRDPFPGVGSSDDFSELQPSESQDSSRVYEARLLEKEDHRFECHLDQFRDVLEACPAEPLYRKDF